MYRADYEWAATAIRERGARRIGMVEGGGLYEYPWWLMLRNREIVSLESTVPGRPARSATSVDAIVCFTPAPRTCASHVPDQATVRSSPTSSGSAVIRGNSARRRSLPACESRTSPGRGSSWVYVEWLVQQRGQPVDEFQQRGPGAEGEVHRGAGGNPADHRVGEDPRDGADVGEVAGLPAVQLSLSGRALLDDPDVVLADLRDAERIRAIFAERRPEVVFHAAALKHLPLLEQYPAEAVKSNVWGTITVLNAASEFGVDAFVNISTDKAANPCSVLGYSKRITERLTAHVATLATGRYLSVRFGNVLGSRGSMLTAFASQIASGGPITVTGPRVSRYFMTVQEAAQLVIRAAAVGRPGEALVLDMGEAVRIAEVAQQMAALAHERVDIVYAGLRPGEKLHEELFGQGETDERPLHPLISHVAVSPLDPELAAALMIGSDPHAVVAQLADLCAWPAPPPDFGRPYRCSPANGAAAVRSLTRAP
jgi:nucleoside-diphosphate-sugar epimerase